MELIPLMERHQIKNQNENPDIVDIKDKNSEGFSVVVGRSQAERDRGERRKCNRSDLREEERKGQAEQCTRAPAAIGRGILVGQEQKKLELIWFRWGALSRLRLGESPENLVEVGEIGVKGLERHPFLPPLRNPALLG